MLDKILNILKNGQDKVLYKINDEYITYKEGYERILQLSNSLKKQGNSPVILYGQKSIDQFISILSCIVAKRCYIPIDLHTPKSRIQEIIKSTNTSLIIKNEQIEINDIECLTTKEVIYKYNNIKEKYNIDNEIAYIIFTSGSTGKSKGVPITYSNLSHFIEWIINLEELTNCNNINILSQASFSFDLSVMDIYFSIYKKCTIIAIDNKVKEDLNKVYNIINKENINFLIMTPTFAKLLLLDDHFNKMNYPHLKYAFFCGECLEVITAKKLKNKFPNITIINAYGPTEATCCVSLVEITNEMLEKELLPVGKNDTSSVEFEIKNEEIVLKGKSVFSGYIDIKSSKCYSENNNNCYETGDLGYIENNYIYCNGRMDDQIKYQGYRIELGDIENNLLKIPMIREAVVIAKKKDKTNIVKMIKAFIVLESNINKNEITEEYVKFELAKLIPVYMIPKKIIILDKIPVNKNGKYDRKKLNEL